jgi:hypothetical protein
VAIEESTGEVFVSNFAANTVSVFARGATTASRTLTGVNWPTGLAFDTSGRLLVGSAAKPLVYVFAGGSSAPVDTIPVSEPTGGIAVDPLWNRLYVTYPRLANPGTGWVEVFDVPTKAKVPGVGAHDLNQPMDIAFQLPTGLYYVSEWEQGYASIVRSYMRNTATPIDDSSLGLVTGPWGVAVSPRSGAVLVSDNAAPYHVQKYPDVTSAVTKVDPSSGPVSGGTIVSVDGTNLGAVTRITFNGVVAEQVGPAFPTTIPVKAPAGTAAGPVAVEVTWGATTAGLLNAFTYTPVAPGPATGLKVTPGNGRVDVTWAAPAFTGGVPVQGYLVTPSPGGAPCSTTERDCTISGLTNGLKYKFTVTTTNTAGLTSVSAPSAEVAPYVPIKQKVKAKRASSKVPRKGFATIVNWVKKPKYATLEVATSCFVPQGLTGAELTSTQLCRFRVYKTGKVKVRTKGYRNVRMTVTIRSIPKAGAPAQYGPSALWTRTWRVR